MADVPAATPVTGTAVKNPTNQTMVVEAVARKLGTMRPPPAEPRPEPEGEAAATRQAVTPPEEDVAPPEDADPELADQALEPEPSGDQETQEETEEQSVEPTLDALAEALETSPDVLMDQLQVKVKVNGQDQTVTLKEALKGYSRDQDYTVRTMKLADEQREFQRQASQVSTQLVEKQKDVDTLIGVLSNQVNFGWTPEALDRLRSENPAEYMAVKDALDNNRRLLGEAKARRDAEIQQAAQAERAQFTDWRKAQQRQLLARMPELADGAKQAKFEGEVGKYLGSHGFTPDDVAQFMKTFDHRQVLIIRDAMRYRSSTREAETTKFKLKGLPKKAKPGAKQNVKVTQISTARDKFKQTGKPKDLAALLRARGVA